MMERPTISEVARVANVAASTVSRVLNGGYASASVKARVEKVMRDLRYTPSPTARNLKTGHTGILGVVVENSQGAWFTQLLGGIEEELVKRKVSIAFVSLNLHGRYDASAARAWVNERRIDGLVFARAGATERPLVRLAAKALLPMAFVGPDETFTTGHTFKARNREAGCAVAEHLLELGHTRIAYFGGPKESVDARERLRGIQEVVQAARISLNKRDVGFGKDYTPESGMAYAEKWLKLPRAQAPTAVVLGNDAMALGFLRTVQAAGARIPDDVSVVGFDGIPESGLCWPGLTTASQPTRAMGIAACKSLFHQIENPEEAQTSVTEFPTELIVRESTGPAPRKKANGRRS